MLNGGSDYQIVRKELPDSKERITRQSGKNYQTDRKELPDSQERIFWNIFISFYTHVFEGIVWFRNTSCS